MFRKKGDFVILTFDPQAGHEQKGRRPALVVSNTLFNRPYGACHGVPHHQGVQGKFPFTWPSQRSRP